MMTEKINSAQEAVFYLSNISVILIGVYFLIQPKKLLHKLMLSSPMLILYAVIPLSLWLDCQYAWLSAIACKEWIWLYILLPPFILVFCLAELAMYHLVINTQRMKRPV